MSDETLADGVGPVKRVRPGRSRDAPAAAVGAA